MLDSIIQEIITKYSEQLIKSFITLVLVGFIMASIKSFISELISYVRARMSDIGYGQKIIWSNEIYIVDKITFKYVVAMNDEKIIHIPISKYMKDVRIYPNFKDGIK